MDRRAVTFHREYEVMDPAARAIVDQVFEAVQSRLKMAFPRITFCNADGAETFVAAITEYILTSNKRSNDDWHPTAVVHRVENEGRFDRLAETIRTMADAEQAVENDMFDRVPDHRRDFQAAKLLAYDLAGVNDGP
jgi:hypothetical protein